MKKVLALMAVFLLLAACAEPQVSITSSASTVSTEGKEYSGTYTGYSWKGESEGVALEETTEKIETVLTLDADGTIWDAKISFLVNKEGNWIVRNDPKAEVAIDNAVQPTAALPGKDTYEAGTSMFTIKTNDKMSFYAAGVSEGTVVAFAFVDPIHRYQLEGKFPADFDFSKTIGELKLLQDFIPTTRTSGGGLLKPESWEEVSEKSILDVSPFSHVISSYGVFKGISNETTLQELLEKAGVVFTDGKPVVMEPVYGFHSNGGWAGNYEAIQTYLIGKNATEVTGLVDFSQEKYAAGINEDNFFGVDDVAGATKTVQDSFDGIAGATVRISREHTSYQRALVAAGIIEESEVIKGRF